MPLSSLKIVGFKSFADPTTLDFAQGVTGIVGPNGSGKSNITEAVRWAMGEQSAKGLRGEKMSDVIFAGTQLRPALNLAEVTLIFDNHDRRLKLDQDQLTVTRKIFRNGESEFYINKKACRLKDITNLFLDSGLGKSSFSIISQGQVEAIFNSRPEDRRMIIEETAGVHQYKLQKDAALQKLVKTTDNLDRVADIIHEIEGRLEPLHEQSSLAKDYIEQKSQYDKLYQGWLVFNIDQKNATKLKTQADLKELSQTLTRLQTEKAEFTKALTAQQTEQTETDQALDTQQQQLVTTTQQLEATKGNLLASTQQQDQAGHQIEDYQTDLQALTTEAQTLQQKYETLQQKHRTIATQQQNLATKIETLQQQVGDSKDDIEVQLQTQNDDYLDLLQQSAQIRNSIVMQQKQQEVLTHQIKHLEDDHQAKLTAQDQLTEKMTTLTADVTAGQKDYEQLQQQVATLAQQEQQSRLRYEQEQQKLLQATEIFQRAQAKLTSLEALQSNFTGFYQGPKYILKHRNQVQGIHGAVAELLTVPKKYQIGIETILNSQLQNIVVQDEQVARQCIDMLRQNHQGRATFLPLSSIKHYTVNPNSQRQLQQLPGYLGIAADLVTVPPEFTKVTAHLLGTVIVVDTLAHGIKIAKAIQRRYRIVTLQGDLLSTSGAMSGGALARNSSNLLQQKAEIQAAKQQITTMQGALAQQQATVTTQKDALETLTQRQQTLQTKLQQQDDTYAQVHDQLTQLKNEVAYGARELKTLAYNLETTKAQQTELVTALQADQAQQKVTETQIAQTNRTIDRLKNTLADYDTQKAQLNTQLNQDRIQNSSLVEQVKSLQLQSQTNRERYQAVAQQRKLLQDKIKQLQTTNTAHTHSKAELTQRIQTLTAKSKTSEQMIQKLKTKRQTLQIAIITQQQKVTRQIELIENAKTEIATNQQKFELLTQQIDADLSELATNYHETYQASKAKLQTMPAMAPAEMNQRLKLLKRGLDDIGPVNLNAIDDYSETKTRYDFLTQQRDDLLTAKDTLMATIAELDQEVTQRFDETFKQVSQAFSEIFPKMFGGGQAELTLTDPEDLLQTGVEIKAQPPGKKLQRLSLLSGGERALTAITVLFAIIKVRPVPFCILDEVEASLDDANVDRYADFLKAYDMQTQFIIITHRKGTMMRANRLYGVTMEESGVSKIVSVALRDAVKTQI